MFHSMEAEAAECDGYAVRRFAPGVIALIDDWTRMKEALECILGGKHHYPLEGEWYDLHRGTARPVDGSCIHQHERPIFRDPVNIARFTLSRLKALKQADGDGNGT